MGQSRTLVLALLTFICCGFLIPGTVRAQATSGEITGRVLDDGGLGVPGATITATNDATGLVRTTVTGAEGDYTIPQLPPGSYTVTAELTGFKKASAPDITITVGMRRTLPFSLAVGALTETVEVQGATPLIE